MSLDALERQLAHTFNDRALLERALQHRSWVAETSGAESNERLEFLGDAVLGWIVADLVFHRHADLPEGTLTDLRKSVVNAAALAEVAEQLDIGPHVRLGRGEAAAGGGQKVSILSDAMEAVLGAVYLDGGRDAAFALVERVFSSRLDDALNNLASLDYKSALQERLAQLGEPAPVYRITSTGPDHDKRFSAAVVVGAVELGSGHGRSKKAAEQAAAAEAVAALDSSADA